MNEMKRYILVDTTGSICEEGKRSLVKYFLLTVKRMLQKQWSDCEVEIYTWNNEIKPLDSKITFCGKADANYLQDFLADKKDCTFLLVTDGEYSEEVKRVLRTSGVRLNVLMIGSDCNKVASRKIAGEKHLFEMCDLMACLHQFMDFEKGI